MSKRTALHLLGPTAVGKTSFALEQVPELAQQLGFAGVDLISADSRHIYTELHTLTGADIPDVDTLDERVQLHGVDEISPGETWSLGRFVRLVDEVSERSWEQGRMPVVIGGTRLYQDHAYGAEPGMLVPPSEELRQRARAMDLESLQELAEELDPKRVEGMNRSDWHNPRRLIRVIEIAQARQGGQLESYADRIATPDTEIWLGLRRPQAELELRIEKRVRDRFEAAQVEVQQFLEEHEAQLPHPLSSALGFDELRAVVSGDLTRVEAIERWTNREQQFAREQLRWWSDDKRISWIDCGENAIVSIELLAAALRQHLE